VALRPGTSTRGPVQVDATVHVVANPSNPTVAGSIPARRTMLTCGDIHFEIVHNVFMTPNFVSRTWNRRVRRVRRAPAGIPPNRC
jgi:hypothetical protein